MLISPLRRLVTDPGELLRGLVRPGMTVLDAGSAMGYFTLPLARLVGDTGHVVAVDLQRRMIDALTRRARRAGLAGRIDARVCTGRSLMVGDLAGRAHFALAFAVLHEVPDRDHFIDEVRAVLRRDGTLLLGEPKSQVPGGPFAEAVRAIEARGFDRLGIDERRGYMTALFRKRDGKPGD